MKTKIFKAAVCLCALSLSACGNKQTLTMPDGELDKCSLRFSWWGGDDRHEATLKAIKLWNTIHPEIEIIPEYGGWDGWTEKVASQIAGDTEPDIMQINYDWLVSLSPEGDGFYDLSLLNENPDSHAFLDLSGFDEETLSFGVRNGKLNAVTVSLSGRGLFYNSDVYKSVGAVYPETWEELIALGEKFGEKKLYPLDLDIQSGGTAWYLAVVYVQQKTGKEFVTMNGELGFTQDDIKKALDFYKKLEDNHVIRTIRARTDEDGNAALYESSEFIGGNVAGVLEWGSSIGKYETVLNENVLEAGPLLTDENGSSGGWMVKPSMLYAISKNTSHPDEASAFMNFLLNNEECAVILGTTRGIPASYYAENALEKSGGLSGLAKENDRLLEQLDTVTISPYMELSRMKEIYNTAIESVSYGTSDTDSAAAKMYEEIKTYLERVRK